MRTRMAVAAVAAAFTLALGLSGCGSMADAGMKDTTSQQSDMNKDTGSDMSAKAMSGMFEGLNGKKVSGKVTIMDGKIMLSGFSSDEGPDLHVYLTTGTDESAVMSGKMIDKVAFDKGDQTFMLDGVDASMYANVVIHCDKAKAVFGAASLS